MTLTIELSDDQAAVLRARAAAQGLTLEDWFRKLATESTPAAARQSRYALSELIAQCDLDAPLTSEDREWMDARPAGREHP